MGVFEDGLGDVLVPELAPGPELVPVLVLEPEPELELELVLVLEPEPEP